MTEHEHVIPSPAVSEVVLRTVNFDGLKAWYTLALNNEPFFTRPRPEKASWTGAQQVAFFKLHGSYPYVQMLGIFEIDPTGIRGASDTGLHHFQLAHRTFNELFDRYDLLKAAGILPVQTWNHGVMTSFYYEDLDGNQAEMTCVNFEKETDFRAYFETEAYRRNISGVAIDADEYISRYRSGTAQAELIKILPD